MEELSSPYKTLLKSSKKIKKRQKIGNLTYNFVEEKIIN